VSEPQPDPVPTPDEEVEPARDNEDVESLLTRGPDEDTRRATAQSGR
jgi:hypothetical protein